MKVKIILRAAQEDLKSEAIVAKELKNTIVQIKNESIYSD